MCTCSMASSFLVISITICCISCNEDVTQFRFQKVADMYAIEGTKAGYGVDN